ncbi:MAG: hypothetical protein K2P70_10550 [Hyphomonadaceae bacterium]|nr:hypothetical protein [Hyphomonadaceae bacterium]
MSKDEMFVGWSAETPRADRRFLLGAGLALIAGSGALGARLGMTGVPVGDGIWDQRARHTLRGILSRDPYPILRTRGLGGDVRTVFLTSSGKTAPEIDAAFFGNTADVTGTLITRGRNAMMAVEDVAAPDGFDGADLAAPAAVDRGPVMLAGEILDAKCWFGAMRPGYGKAHKACAALCARGGLPLAFCQIGACGDGTDAPLLLDENGVAFSRVILPLVADPVTIQGRLVAVGDVMQLRASLDSIRRI